MRLFFKRQKRSKQYEVFAKLMPNMAPKKVIAVSDELQAKMIVSSYVQMGTNAFYKAV